MTPNEFRALALGLPGAVEGAHMGHPDFRIGGKIFASIGPKGDWGMVKLPPAEQARLARAEPESFESFGGAWGRHGCTKVHLAAARRAEVRQALHLAWRNTAPKRILRQLEE